MKNPFSLYLVAMNLALLFSPNLNGNQALENDHVKVQISKEGIDSMLIQEMIQANPFIISPEKVLEITHRLGIEVDELLRKLVPIAQTYARPAISNYYVGVAALGKSGNIYLGVNLEFTGIPLHHTVHAEQFLVALARSKRETQLISMALSAAPCGHCRQFLYEMGNTNEFKLYIKDSPAQLLSSLLPEAFGPQDLGLSGGLLEIPEKDYMITCDYSLRTLALEAAYNSYAPCTKAESGVAILTKDGHIYSGSYLETVAFNPSLAPLQVAIINLIADGRDYHEITDVMLMEQMNAKISQEVTTRQTLSSIAPEANFTVRREFLHPLLKPLGVEEHN